MVKILILGRIEKMEEFRRALDAAKIKPPEMKRQQHTTDTINLIKLLREGKGQEFNERRSESTMFDLDFQVLTSQMLNYILQY
jgi:hypothetical protein